MATNNKRPARATPTPVPTNPGGRSRSTWIAIIGVLALIALAAVIAIVSTGDDSNSTARQPTVSTGSTGGTGSTGSSPAAIEETRPVTVTGTALPSFPESGTDPALGVVAPTVAGASFDGAPVSIQPGQPTLVVFLAHWCPHCQREMPLLVKWNSAGQVPAGLQVIGVATSTTSDRPNYPPSKWLRNGGWPWPMMADSSDTAAGVAFGLTSFPYFVMLDKAGKVLWRTSGEIEITALTKMITDSLAAG
ncbi:MAG: TlpA disulfide reductase family protein [Ilumatobacteraceae bacterium]